MNSSIPFASKSDEEAFFQLVTSGLLGPLNFDLSPEEVIALLGKPDKVARPPHERDKDKLVNLFYRNILVSFSDMRLAMFHINFRGSQQGLPEPLQATWHEAIRRIDLDTFVAYLKEHGIRCQYVVADDAVKDVICLHQSGLEVIFDSDREYKIRQITSTRLGLGNRRFRDC